METAYLGPHPMMRRLLLPASLLSIGCALAACMALSGDSASMIKTAPWAVAISPDAAMSLGVAGMAIGDRVVAWESVDCPAQGACAACEDQAADTSSAVIVGLVLSVVAAACDRARLNGDASVFRAGSVVAGASAAWALGSALSRFHGGCYAHAPAPQAEQRLGAGFYLLALAAAGRLALAIAHAFVPVAGLDLLQGSLLGRAAKTVAAGPVQPYFVRKSQGVSVPVSVPARALPHPEAERYKQLKIDEQRARDARRAFWARKAQDPVRTLTQYQASRGAAPARKFAAGYPGASPAAIYPGASPATGRASRAGRAAPTPARAGRRASAKVAMMARLGDEHQEFFANAARGLGSAAAAAALSLNLAGGMPAPAEAITKDEVNQLSYLQVKGTGLANRCVEVGGEGKGAITVDGKKQFVDLCMEPKAFFVANSKETDFVPTKLMTRQTYTLDGVSGTVEAAGGNLRFKEKDGIDYAATSVQMPGGYPVERVPFLFSVKSLDATGKGTTIKPGYEFGGPMKVPEYRTGLFLDPKGRGSATGYDMPVALPGLQTGEEGDNDLFKENNKIFSIGEGRIEFEVTKVDEASGEIGGVFVSTQPSDTDLGSKTPKTMLLKGIWYSRLE